MTVVERLRAAFELLPAVRLAVLFGSAARGTSRPKSDIDVGVSLERGADRSPTLGVVLERAIGQPVVLVWLDEAPPLLRFEIARDGVMLVEREPIVFRSSRHGADGPGQAWCFMPASRAVWRPQPALVVLH